MCFCAVYGLAVTMHLDEIAVAASIIYSKFGRERENGIMESIDCKKTIGLQESNDLNQRCSCLHPQ